MSKDKETIKHRIGIEIPSEITCTCGDEGEPDQECIERERAAWEKVKDCLEAAGYKILSSNEPEEFMAVEGEYGYCLAGVEWGHFGDGSDE